MPNKFSFSRRGLMGLGAATLLSTGLPSAALALTENEAEALVTELVSDLYDVINSGRSDDRIYRDFERFLDRYADMAIIAQSVMGVDWRQASSSQRRNFTNVFKTYIARKYGSRFRELIGGQIEVTGARAIRNFYEVTSVARLRGESPFEVIWLVSDASGSARVFNLVLQGINLRTTEREEIGNLLDINGGDIDAMIADLRAAS